MEKKALRVLVVEDDASMAAGVVRGLRAAGMEVELASDGDGGARLALSAAFDAIVLDAMLPGKDGFEVLELLRARVRTPVVMLTARSDLKERLRAFELGVVDFVPKPFWMEELVARVRAHAGERPAPPRRVIRFADAEADLDARTIDVAGRRVDLTNHEWSVLAYMLERPGRAVSRSALAGEALDPFEAVDARTVDSHVAHLRKKLGARARGAIVTVWGIGYRFDPETRE